VFPTRQAVDQIAADPEPAAVADELLDRGLDLKTLALPKLPDHLRQPKCTIKR
jgi:hypothetical protein